MTPTKRLAELLLGQSVESWIATKRDAGRSWRQIADDLSEQTNGQVTVSHEAVRLWMSDAA